VRALEGPVIVRLEDLIPGASIRGVVPDAVVSVVAVQWHGTSAVTMTYKAADGRVADRLLYRSDEGQLEIVDSGRPWTFDGEGELFRLVSEAKRIDLAYLFDPYVAVSTALVEPLPHQITAVYEEMLPRQPLRFLLADDPGAGKTIMTGLFIRELLIRGDLRRCLIITPGSLVEQWQIELGEKFRLPFGILNRGAIETSKSGNPINDDDLLIARLDMLSRDEDLQLKLENSHDWDLIVFDEAHKLSATLDADGIKRTKRRVLGEKCRDLARHFLLLTATPHSGKPEEFELFMSLLDPDRFERQHRVKEDPNRALARAGDLMRRLLKEKLVHFDGRPLFPKRYAYVVPYKLTEPERELYEAVTHYVREEMSRADRLKEKGEGKRGLIVGFALTVLQRRLASSPEAIYQSLRRRRERLEHRLAELEAAKQDAETRLETPELSLWQTTDIEELVEDEEEVSADETEELEEQVLDLATAASTIAELRSEIASLHNLEALAAGVRRLGTDRKWAELSSLVQDAPEMKDAAGSRRKLVVFTEHRDTLNYLVGRLTNLLGRPDAVVAIHGGLRRDERRRAEAAFKQDPEVAILVATDAAGEGINLQRAHLMVNYDLPWNPNRLEQRFGRIHRIGQNEICHLWNLVAVETREGDVYARLLQKIEEESKALGGEVFDVLGQLTFGDRPLRQLLIDAIRAGDSPEAQAFLNTILDASVDRDRLRELLDERALGTDVLDATKIASVREDMERANARKLQPHFIRTFFLAAFEFLGGRITQREAGRYEISRVPAVVRQRAQERGMLPVTQAYERVTFEKELINPLGQPLADFVCPGHPLLDATIDVLLGQHRDLLRQGTVLIDGSDPSETPRVLIYLEHAITDQRLTRAGTPHVVSRRLEFVELAADGSIRAAGPAPYHDYRAPKPDELARMPRIFEESWLASLDLEQRAVDYAIERVAPLHLDEVRSRTEDRVDRTRAAVYERLTQEIAYWDRRAEELKAQELAGKSPRLNSGKARQRADELTERRTRRTHELDLERKLTPLPPVIVGAAVVIPIGLVLRLGGGEPPDLGDKETRRIELLAMKAVMRAERSMGYEPRDVSAENRGYDVESKDGGGQLRFVEVKGRVQGATTVTVTKNEILTCLNTPDRFWLAVVEVRNGVEPEPRYLQAPFQKEPDFAATSVHYSLKELFGARPTAQVAEVAR
jgi:SNF2 family DNA or RNA helicase